MTKIYIPLMALVALGGCMSLHANVPEEVVRQYARKDGMDVAASCAQDGRSFSEGAVVCMADRRMTCDESGRWTQSGACGGDR